MTLSHLLGLDHIARVTLVNPYAGTILVWKRGSTQVSVSRHGLYIIRGLHQEGCWVRAEDVLEYQTREPLLPLAKQWFKTFLDPSLPPLVPALEATLFRLGQESLKLTS